MRIFAAFLVACFLSLSFAATVQAAGKADLVNSIIGSDR